MRLCRSTEAPTRRAVRDFEQGVPCGCLRRFTLDRSRTRVRVQSSRQGDPPDTGVPLLTLVASSRWWPAAWVAAIHLPVRANSRRRKPIHGLFSCARMNRSQLRRRPLNLRSISLCFEGCGRGLSHRVPAPLFCRGHHLSSVVRQGGDGWRVPPRARVRRMDGSRQAAARVIPRFRRDLLEHVQTGEPTFSVS